ncbi:hypothetical protein G9A89_008763 [Geosiphon pyriformis]|nr:hypothetical protein G9A89_008763 [Geosiphon pyriformis]
MPLNYVNDDVFSDVIVDIGMEELSLVKHCGGEVLVCLLKLLNLYLSMGAVSNLWKEAWISIIPKPYEPIILVETAHKILSKILSDRISLACSKFNVLHVDNFSVLKGTLIQSPIFAIGSVVENALEKNRELWLVLQDIHKAYDSVGWDHLVMTDFGLLDSYRVHDEYRIDSRFVAKSGRIKTSREKTFFLAAGAFVDDTIWVGSSQASTQYILNIASKFFVINNISINNNKTVAISINREVKNALLLINEPNLAQAYKNPIVSYHVQFSFVTLDMCCKWDIMIRKSLRAKASLPYDFPSEVLHHSFLYELKPFEQQVLRWFLLNSLQFPIKLYVSPVNNFLAEVIKIFLENELSLSNNLLCAFRGSGNFLMSGHSGLVFTRGALCFYWFSLTSDFMNNYISLGVRTATATKEDVLGVLNSDRFSEVHDSLLEVWSDCIEVYMNRSLRCAGSVGTAAYFLAANVGIGVKVTGFLSFILAELQAVMLVLECVSSSCSVVLYSYSQSVIDACIFEVKVKKHSDMLGNIRADTLANKAISLSLSLPVNIQERFLVVEKTAISGNVHYFA